MSKYCYIVVLFVWVGGLQSLQARHVRYTSMVMEEEFVDGREFVHTIKSDQGKIEEKFMVDKSPVLKDEYHTLLEEAQVKELRKERERNDRRIRSKIAFCEQSYAVVLEKLATKLLQEIVQLIDRLQDDHIRQYYVFKDDGVQSLSHLSEMKHFAHHGLKQDIAELVEDHDLVALQEMIDKVDDWPDLLEGCFKDSVHHAIKQSDDTAALKELLSMVASESV